MQAAGPCLRCGICQWLRHSSLQQHQQGPCWHPRASLCLYHASTHTCLPRPLPLPCPAPCPFPCIPLAGFMLVRLGFLVSLLATFPLQMGPFRDSLWKLLFRQQLQVGGHALHGMHAGRLLGACWAALPGLPSSLPLGGVPACLPFLLSHVTEQDQSRQSRGYSHPHACLPAYVSLCLQGPGLWLVTYLSLGGVYWAAAYLTTIWEPLIVLGSTAGKHAALAASAPLPHAHHCSRRRCSCFCGDSKHRTEQSMQRDSDYRVCVHWLLLSAGVLIAFIFPGLLGASLEEDITESAGARRTRGCALCCAGAVRGLAWPG